MFNFRFLCVVVAVFLFIFSFGRRDVRECARLNLFFLWDGEPMPDRGKRFKLIRFAPLGPGRIRAGGVIRC